MTSSARVRIALVLAVASFGGAVVGALGPAREGRTTYSWPPKTPAMADSQRGWYTPLLLIRKEPEAITALLPCDAVRTTTSSPATLRQTLIATARVPESSHGLLVAARDGQLVVKVGARRVTRVAVGGSASDASCSYRLDIRRKHWSLEGPGAVSRFGDLSAMPRVSGLFTTLDLRRAPGLAVEVTTTQHGSRPVARQMVAWWLAAALAFAALVLISIERPATRALRAVPDTVRRAYRQARAADAAIAAVLAVWWLIAPTFWDDGWVSARVRNHPFSGGFSVYYNAFAGNLPLGYWTEWVQLSVAVNSPTLLAQRIPAVACIAAIWVLCRWILARVTASIGRELVSVWILACSFAAITLAWTMTLRPEPKVALVVTAIFASTVHFVDRPRAGALAVAAGLVPFALSAHPTGLLGLAPLLVAAPTILRWARMRLAMAGVLVSSATALLLVLVTVESDLGSRAAEARLQRAYGDGTASWYHEVVRYWHVGTPLQRTAVALMLLAVLAFLVRRRGDKRPLINLPSATVGVGLILLLATPSKLPYHFGVLLGVASVAIATESARLRECSASSTRLWVVRLSAVVLVVLAASWSWISPNRWTELDLRTLDWNIRLGPVPVSLAYVALTAAVAIVVGAFIREQRRPSADQPVTTWRTHDVVTPALAIPALVFTIGVLAADAVNTASWTVARQNIGTLTRQQGCGLAEDAFVADLQSVRPLAPVRTTPTPPTEPRVRRPPVAGLDLFTLRPLTPDVAVTTPWFLLASSPRIGLFVGGTPGPTDRLELEWGRVDANRIQTLGVISVAAAPIIADLRSGTRYVEPTWQFLSGAELPTPPTGARAVRVRYSSVLAPRAVLAVTAPVRYGNVRLADAMRTAGSASLVIPNLLMYFPCVRQPRLEDGIVEVPARIIAYRSPWPVGVGTSPFDGLLDLYRVNRMSLTDSRNPVDAAVVYEFERRIPGMKIAEPIRTTTYS
ncbi:MAG: arabinosyltransferase domain-containing protein [Gaiellaceae bacterium]